MPSAVLVMTGGGTVPERRAPGATAARSVLAALSTVLNRSASRFRRGGLGPGRRGVRCQRRCVGVGLLRAEWGYGLVTGLLHSRGTANRGRSREGPPRRRPQRKLVMSGRAPQDVTSAEVRHGGANLQQEVEPQQTERPPRDSRFHCTPDQEAGSNIDHTSRPGPLTVLRCTMLLGGPGC